jgi:hypothetical protein
MVDRNQRKEMVLRMARKALDDRGLHFARIWFVDTPDGGMKVDPRGRPGEGFSLSGPELIAGDDGLFQTCLMPVCIGFAHGVATALKARRRRRAPPGLRTTRPQRRP